LRQRQDYPNPEDGSSAENDAKLLQAAQDPLLESVRHFPQHQNRQLPSTTLPTTTTHHNSNSSDNYRRSRRKVTMSTAPTLEPTNEKLERFELFCTNQSYYLVGCNKINTAYRVMKMDRTLIERPVVVVLPAEESSYNTAMPPRSSVTFQASRSTTSAPNATSTETTRSFRTDDDSAHKSKPTLRPLSEFLTEDDQVYSQEEIQDMLDMIHDGNRLRPAADQRNAASGGADLASDQQGGGLQPICTACGIVGFVRFLDCYYLTMITGRTKVGSIGGNGIYSITSTESFPIKPAERIPGSTTDMDQNESSVLLSMWNRGKRSVGLGLTNREIAELRYQGLYQVVDLTKNFFFSYTYDLTRSLQENFLSATSQPFPPSPFKDMYAWNYFLTRELEACTSSMTSFHWVMPLIHGRSRL
jgi:hypothetical protein